MIYFLLGQNLCMVYSFFQVHNTAKTTLNTTVYVATQISSVHMCTVLIKWQIVFSRKMFT